MAETIKLCDGPSVPRGLVYLPIITIHSTPGAQPVEPADVETPEAALYRLLTTDTRQQRPALTWCDSLAAAARWKATDIAEHDYWSHRASNGDYANETARRFGCALPEEYAGNWNGIESLAGGSMNAASIFNALANSETHRVHLFGLNDFFRRQVHCGIGMVAGGRFGWVWCCLIAPCGK